MVASPGQQANQLMVERLIAEGALWDPALIEAFRQTPRHCFLDRIFLFQRKHGRWQEVHTTDPGPAELKVIYSDRALITRLTAEGPEGRGGLTPISSSSQPSLMAQMLQDLHLAAGQRVLEVGAGTGYNAALMAHVVGPGNVHSLDVDRSVLAEAWEHLQGFPERGVRLYHADGREGFADAAPYDRIMATAATEDLQPAWLEQLAAGGLLLAPLALAPGLAFLVRGTAHQGCFDGRLTRGAYFMPLRGEEESGAGPGDFTAFSGPLQGLPAPWAGWFERRRSRTRWFNLIQAVVFYGLLRGLNVHYRSQSDGSVSFGVSTPRGDGQGAAVCWLGAEDWQVSGDAGRELGWGLWHAFLDAGGPWPTEFRLRASPTGGLSAAGAETYQRQGTYCQQIWQLIQPRDRWDWGV
jgi:protein-L-isoaspartate(D-aspartate) O-methyltransferase